MSVGKAARSLLVLVGAWAAWALLFFAPIPFMPETSGWGVISALIAFFALPAIALKQTAAWREGGPPQTPSSGVPSRLLGFSRHVPLLSDGRGVTYRITKGPHGPRFTWSFDAGVNADDLSITILAKENLARIEAELGLPISFPHTTPEGRAEAKRRSDATRPSVEQLEEAAAGGDQRARFQLWGRVGTPITDESQLKVGTYYHLGFDIGRYIGSFEGCKWLGTEFENDEDDNPPGIWHEFEVAESTMKGGARYQADEIASRAAEEDPLVRVIPAPQDVAERAYQDRHAAHLAWEARRRSR
ncbi:hypothetical protein ACF9IK_30495 [Kitasatospora hibisci]|uniref:hypothetical protein n=1 Tax=Kitasatospora hibisci TaxID=3369522 RepID=UPI0037547CF9